MTRKKTTEEFIFELQVLLGDKVDCSLVDYQGAFVKVTLVCSKHGQFNIKPNNVLSGQGCRECGNESMKLLLSMNTERFIRQAIERHGDKYDYSETTCDKVDDHVIYRCRRCDRDVSQSAKFHLAGRGCPSCSLALKRWDRAEFLLSAVNVHGVMYKYDLSGWDDKLGKNNKVDILCPRCDHWFKQLVQVHITSRSGCPRCCNATKLSKPETAWLDSLNVSLEHRQVRVLNTRWTVDALVGDTVYEFFGSFWHGDPRHGPPEKVNAKNKKTYLQLYNETMSRCERLTSFGYTVVFVWELDWLAGKTFSSAHPPRWQQFTNLTVPGTSAA